IEVGGKGERERDQSAPTQTLEEPARNEPWEPCESPHACGRGDRGSRGEDQHADRINGCAAAHVRIRAEQRHRHHVAAQKTGDDRSGLLEAVDGQANVGDHRGQDRDDDVSVEGGDEEACAGEQKKEGAIGGGGGVGNWGRRRYGTGGGEIVTAALKPLRSTSTELAVPLSPKRPDSTALRIRWSEPPIQSTASTSPDELSCGSMLWIWLAVYVASTLCESTSPTLSAPRYFGLTPAGMITGKPPWTSNSLARSGIRPASTPVSSVKLENGGRT